MFLIDTNVFSKIFGHDRLVRAYVESIEAFIDVTVYIECLQGSKSNHEKRVIEKYITRFPLLPLTPSVSARSISLIRQYSNTHGLLLADSLIAATAIENDLTLVTYNTRDFEFVRNLKTETPKI